MHKTFLLLFMFAKTCGFFYKHYNYIKKAEVKIYPCLCVTYAGISGRVNPSRYVCFIIC